MKVLRDVWVVEMLVDAYSRLPPQWEPTVGVRLSRNGARREMGEWKKRNPETRFRIRKYSRGGRK